MDTKNIEESVAWSIRNLRESKLKQGFPFMINSKSLPDGQCYLEYLDGSINLVSLCREIRGFKVITKLNAEESDLIRKKYNIV